MCGLSLCTEVFYIAQLNNLEKFTFLAMKMQIYPESYEVISLPLWIVKIDWCSIVMTSLFFFTQRIFVRAVRNILSCSKQYEDAGISSYVYQKIPCSDFHIELHSQAHSTELCMTFLMVEQKEKQKEMRQSACCLHWLLGTSVHACKSQDTLYWNSGAVLYKSKLYGSHT